MPHTPYQCTKVADNEEVARVLFSPSFFDGDKVGSSAFFLEELRNGPEDYVSVFRLSLLDAKEIKGKALGFKPRHEGDNCYGHCKLKVEKIRNINKVLQDDNIDGTVDVVDKGSDRNPAHAGIIITLYGNKVTAQTVSFEVMYIQSLLAELCYDITPY